MRGKRSESRAINKSEENFMKKLARVMPILFAAFLITNSANAQWNYAKTFPDSNTYFSQLGINNGIAVDPDGKIWIQSYSFADVVDVGEGIYDSCDVIRVYNRNGSEASFSPIKTITVSGVTDTLTSSFGDRGYGLTVDQDGNIIADYSYLSPDTVSMMYRLNYKTGQGMAKVTNPISGYNNSIVTPAVDAAGKVFIGPIWPPGAVTILNENFSGTGITLLGSTTNFSRCIAVTPDGKDVYFPNYFPLKYTIHFHSNNGDAGPYDSVGTVLQGLVAENAVWDRNGNLWVTGGNAASGFPDPPFTPYTWYAWNPATNKIVNSIDWHGSVSADPRPRGIAFSSTGDTMYVCVFNQPRACVEMFVREMSTSGPPTISSFSPTSGPIGTSVTITGTNFDTSASNNIVYFGTVKATVATAASTQLTVTVPLGATYQPITVTDTSTGLTAYSNKPFTVTFASAQKIDTTTFASGVSFPTNAGPLRMAMCDLDGDGKPDIIVVNSNSGNGTTFSVYRNTSTRAQFLLRQRLISIQK